MVFPVYLPYKQQPFKTLSFSLAFLQHIDALDMQVDTMKNLVASPEYETLWGAFVTVGDDVAHFHASALFLQCGHRNLMIPLIKTMRVNVVKL